MEENTPRTVLLVPITSPAGDAQGSHGAVSVTLDVERRWYTVRDTDGSFRMKTQNEARAFTAAFEAAGWGVRVTKRND